MEPGLAFTLCGLGNLFSDSGLILGFVNKSKTNEMHSYKQLQTVKDILGKRFKDSLRFLRKIHYTGTKLTMSYIRILVHIYHIMSHGGGKKSRYDIIQTIQRSHIFRATIPKYISY